MKSIRHKAFLKYVRETVKGSRLVMEQEYTQHGNTSCLRHRIQKATGMILNSSISDSRYAKLEELPIPEAV